MSSSFYSDGGDSSSPSRRESGERTDQVAFHCPKNEDPHCREVKDEIANNLFRVKCPHTHNEVGSSSADDISDEDVFGEHCVDTVVDSEEAVPFKRRNLAIDFTQPANKQSSANTTLFFERDSPDVKSEPVAHQHVSDQFLHYTDNYLPPDSQYSFNPHIKNEVAHSTASYPGNYGHVPAPAEHTPDTNVSQIEPSFDIDIRLQAIRELAPHNPLATALLEIETMLADELMKMDYGAKISHVYNPVDYAYKPHLEYYRKYCRPSAEVVIIGMNPGPYGMSQTGVPFGEVKTVTDWMDICETVGSPTKVHTKRPILGFDCKRSEVSGTRIWTFLREAYGTPEELFNKCFIYNYCPLSFMIESGKNFTPAQLPAQTKRKLTALCDEALHKSVILFPNCKSLVGVGRFAEQRIKEVCKAGSLPHRQMYLLHPSPQNPNANKNWTPIARKSFEELGILPPSSQEVDVACDAAVKRKLFQDDSQV